MNIKKKKVYILRLGILLFSLILFISLIPGGNSSPVDKPRAFAGFAELDPNNREMIIIGDTQGTSFLEFWREDNKEKTPLLIKEIANRKPALVINLGDLVFCGTSAKQWKRFDDAHKPLRDNRIPYFCIPGNHEYWCNHQKTMANVFSRFPHLDKRKWYSFRFQKIAFVMADSNFSRLSPAEMRSQVDWFNRELFDLDEDPDVDYIVVCCHHPPFTNSKVVKPAKEVERNFVRPFLGLKKAAVFFSGHCHSYERFKVAGKYFIVSGGGGGPRQKLNIDKSKRKYNDEFEGPSLRFFNFCQVTIEPDRLCFRVIKLTEEKTFTIADEFTLPKP
jgi:3',5'-cyclic AMP phosphodiesterase CpdA